MLNEESYSQHGARSAKGALPEKKHKGRIQIQHFRSINMSQWPAEQLQSVQEVVAPGKFMSHPLMYLQTAEFCAENSEEKRHIFKYLQNRKRFERVHIIYLIGFLLSIFEASIDHLNQTHRLIKPEVSTIQPSYPHHIPMKRLVLYGFILKSPLIYQSSWEFHKSYKSPIHKSYKSFNEFRMFRIIVPPNPPQKNEGLSKFYSHKKKKKTCPAIPGHCYCLAKLQGAEVDSGDLPEAALEKLT